MKISPSISIFELLVGLIYFSKKGEYFDFDCEGDSINITICEEGINIETTIDILEKMIQVGTKEVKILFIEGHDIIIDCTNV